jgi:hypothetical protein
LSRLEKVIDRAKGYLDGGWRLVPVRARDKMPAVSGGWQNMRLTLEQLTPMLKEDSNLGVLLGGPSNGLVDIDLDCVEAAVLADLFLPQSWVFGRPSKLRSHWLYVCPGIKTEKFQFVDESLDVPGMVLELRSTGCQTVIPPSVHKSGELIEWSSDDDLEAPVEIAGEELRVRVSKLAAASLIMRYAGETAAREWAAGAPCPVVPRDIVECVRRWLGAPAPAQAAPTRYANSGDVVRRARQYLARIPPAISGNGGHTQTLLAAEHMVRGFKLSDETALALLEEEYNPRCDPPWTTKELEHKVLQAREKGTAVEWGKHLKKEAAHAA